MKRPCASSAVLLVASVGWSGQGPATIDEAAARALVEDLRHDDRRFNATDALSVLRSCGPEVVPALEAALHSDDWQQRQLACEALRRIGGYDPSDRMLEVCIEGLRRDGLPMGDGRYTTVFNAADGTRFLVQHPERARPLLRPALESADEQQRFLAAFVLGFGADVDEAARICRVLMPHLRSNAIRSDAILAAAAIRALGKSAVPQLLLSRDSDDEQQRGLVALLIAHARGAPPEELAGLARAVNGDNGDGPRLGWPMSADPTDLGPDDLSAIPMRWRHVRWPETPR